MRSIAFAFVFLFACGKQPTANPCVEKGATYIASASETSGTCGAIPNQTVNISSDGTIPAAKNNVCDATEADGCTQRNTNCRTTTDGVTCTASSSITFRSDKSGGSGTSTITCTGAATCSSSYLITYTRQN